MVDIQTLLRSKGLRTAASFFAIVAAGLGFISDVLGIRGESRPVVVTVASLDTGIRAADTTTTQLTPVEPSDPHLALEKIRVAVEATSSSGSVDGCGTHALLATPGGLQFFEWVDGQWEDFSENVQSPTTQMATGIQVIDIPRDGIPEFLVTFERSSKSSPVGAILSMGSHAAGCGSGLGWKYFAGGDGSFVKSVAGLSAKATGRLASYDADGMEVEYVWNDGLDAYVHDGQSGDVSIPQGSAAQLDVVEGFMRSYAAFTADSFNAMTSLVETNSPAESLVKFLQFGRQVSAQAGIGDGAGFELVSTGNGYRIKFPGGSSYFENFVGSNGLISTFNLNGVSLDRLIRYDLNILPTSRRCTPTGVCIGIRGVQLGVKTVYFALFVDSWPAGRSLEFSSANLTTMAGKQKHIAATTPIRRTNSQLYWSVSFPMSELPWGGMLDVGMKIDGIRETASLPVPG